MSGAWRVTFFGGLEVSNSDTPLRFATRKAAALFAFLAYHARKAFSRDYLVTLLWPDDVERARNSLRVALSSLKKGLEAHRCLMELYRRAGRRDAAPERGLL